MASPAAAASGPPAAPAAAQADAADLPKGVVRRIVKEKLAGAASDGKDLAITKEALLAFGESAKVFISYVTATANDVCKEKKRATVSGEDVLTALEELEFGELLPELKDAFEVFKKASSEKKAAQAERTRKRKSAAADGGAAGEAGGAPEALDTAATSDKDEALAAKERLAAAGGDAEMREAA